MRGFHHGRRRPNAGAYLLFAAAAVVACVSCSDVGPRSSGIAAVTFEPTFSREAVASYERASLVGLTLDNVHFRLERTTGEVARDTSIALVTGQDSIVIETTVHLNASPERLRALLELRVGAVVLFSGSTDLTAVAGAATNVPSIPMTYVGPL